MQDTTFLMSNGAPACFAASREEAAAALGTLEIQEIPMGDLSRRDLYWAELFALEGFNCYAVAC